MLHENELVMLFISLGVVIFIILKRHRFRQFYGWKLLFAAFLFFTAGCIFTIVEGFILGGLFNNLEHLCYFVNSVILMIWCFMAITITGEKNE